MKLILILLALSLPWLTDWMVDAEAGEHGYSQADVASMNALVARVTKPKPVILYRTEAERLAAIAEVFEAGL